MKPATINHFRRAFTLIELLVVISIIGILAALTIASYSGAQKRARDSQRQSDVNQYRTALENFATGNTGSLYPSRTTATGTAASTTLCSDLTTTYISACPEDPRYPDDNTFTYLYQSDGSGGGALDATHYVLWTQKENPTASFWIVCSNGQVGTVTSGIPPSSGTCPL